ncbi:PD40 domain-containing protein [Maribacter sp. ANRC-HE7]|uniref:Tricorn protease homolog n=1 Tax=Maribacter aquimaris TaxID=2737171 RepID=A0ABR7UVK2_9FLAO|nr:S41 family peptidase [Maribacter aquimaris]MBD0776484.1 PD40 domain-containing protein [Maribacter aquimaris]
MKNIPLLLLLFCLIESTNAQISAQLLQHPDVSKTHITFIYGDDVWIVPKSGGVAHQLSSPEGAESYPRFSPDGSMVAFTANYHGNSDVYLIDIHGGIPKRLTFHGQFDRVLGWTPNGDSILFASSRESGRQRYNQFYTVSRHGGSPKKLPIPYGEFASFSPDGQKVAYTDRSRVNRNWKRYRGGTAPDISIFDLNTFSTENITNTDANDELPMWNGDIIYYMSDNGPNKRNNLWKYDLSTKSNTQLTKFTDFDITFPESGPDDIVFEAGGKLYLYNLSSNTISEVEIQVVSDQKGRIPQQKKVASFIQNTTLSPDGNRVIVQARGELFNLPANEGFTENITRTSGSAERKPAWSPDGKHVAYWSDSSGEYQLYLHDMTGEQSPKMVTDFKNGFNYSIHWSPDSKKIAYVDQAMGINYLDLATGKVVRADKGKYMFEGGLENFRVTWTPDSKWFTYARGTENPSTTAIFAFNTANNKLSQLTSGYYSDNSPTFSADGKYLFFTTNRTFEPVYSDLDNTFIYPNTTSIAVATLNKSVSSLLALKNDSTKLLEEGKSKDEKDGKSKKKKDDDTDGDAKKEVPKTTIDIVGFENRVEMLDIPAGNLGNLAAIEGKLLFTRFPNSGAPEDTFPSLDYYDFEEREVKNIISKVDDFEVSADGTKILVNQEKKLAVLEITADQKIDKTVPTQNMVMYVTPQDEWKQIFNDVWRFERDYFYDPGMHGVDWNVMRTKYGQLIEQSNTRNDVNIIIGDLIAELNASHTYTGGGDTKNADMMNVGYLGADIALENGKYRIKKIISSAPWDVEVRSPLAKPGINIGENDYILAVNGRPIDVTKPIFEAFQGLADATVQITTNSTPSLTNAKKHIIKLMESETRLRHLAWIENNRKQVEKATNGKIGYVYVRSTGLDGQNELVRQFYAQMNKEGLIIDERFNSGGQIPDRFVELLDREPLAFWAVRDGKDWAWPPSGNFGPKVMLINGFSGSGGDAFPDYFKKRGIGPLIGTRTWGGLIGISGAPGLIDNGRITVPTFRMYDPNGEWFKEGHGVDPDIKVVEDFQRLANGIDVQLEAAIKEVLRLLDSPSNFKTPSRPNYEKRN